MQRLLYHELDGVSNRGMVKGGDQMFFVDTFTRALTKEKEKNAPPERYYEYRKGVMDGVFIETYVVSYKPLTLIDFAYTEEVQKLYYARKEYLERYGVSLNAPLYAYTVPPKWYEEAEKKLKEGENE